MDVTLFEVLHGAMMAGGTGLSAAKLGGKAKTKLIQGLCDSGMLEKTGKTYSITPAGQEAWKRQASADQRRAIEAKEREALVGFLRLVEEKTGVALKAAEQKRFPSAIFEKARQLRLMTDGAKANSYVLLPAGREFLLAGKPVQEQVSWFRETFQTICERWSALHRRQEEELSAFAREGVSQSVTDAAASALRDRMEKVRAGFDSALKELEAVSQLTALAHALREALLTTGAETLRRLEEVAGRVRETAESLEQRRKQQAEELGAFNQLLEKRLAAWGSMTDGTSGTTSPDEDEMWRTTRRAYEELRKKGVVKVPELVDSVRAAFPSLTPRQMRDCLRGWHEQGRLALQLCNDRYLEPRANEGIESPYGLLFYVQIS